MNLFNSSFLCLDIGTYGVRGMGHIIHEAKIAKSATFSVKNTDTLFAIKSVIDELEQQLGTHFLSAYITGNFGQADFRTQTIKTSWDEEHQISETDLYNQISKISCPDDFYNIHIIPLYYSTPNIKNITNVPIEHVTTQLQSLFGIISYEKERTQHISEILRRAHIQSCGFFDPTFLQNAIYRQQKDKVFFIDFGEEFTTISIWSQRGPLYFEKIKLGQTDLTNSIAKKLNISNEDADFIKTSTVRAIANENDRFTPINTSETFAAFSLADVNDVFIPQLQELISIIHDKIDKYIPQFSPTKIIISGGGSLINDIDKYLEHSFNLPVENKLENEPINALSAYVWDLQLQRRNKYIQKKTKIYSYISNILKLFHRKKHKKRKCFIPILPSTMCFDMKNKSTYTMFQSGGISMLHIDVMDGLYVNNIVNNDTKDIINIRTNTNAHLHVHLMTESPSIWATDVIKAGADTVIISTNTSGVKEAIYNIKQAHKRCGIAVSPKTQLKILTPILNEIDEIMVMAVEPGEAGQEFDKNILAKIKTLNYTRKKHGLKYLISVDGGINPETAKLCWQAGADLLISGSYLAKSVDFPLAVQSLLKN